MEHPEDALDGRPRGASEIKKSLDIVNLPELTTVVSDSWKGTIAAVKRYRRARGYREDVFKHEMVNHSEGVAVKENGYTTNHIEQRWSTLKRWARKRCGGKLPRSKDREFWNRLLQEFQFRKLAHAQKGFPYKSTMRVNFGDVLDIFKANL